MQLPSPHGHQTRACDESSKAFHSSIRQSITQYLLSPSLALGSAPTLHQITAWTGNGLGTILPAHCAKRPKGHVPCTAKEGLLSRPEAAGWAPRRQELALRPGDQSRQQPALAKDLASTFPPPAAARSPAWDGPCKGHPPSVRIHTHPRAPPPRRLGPLPIAGEAAHDAPGC